MKLYRHLAWDGIRKNSRLYVPYLLTGVGAVSFFYILVALSRLPEGTLPGRGSVQVILNLGSFVLWMFSLLLLFYTHSFLIRRRNREFALYNVLGMGKRDIARILCWETLLSGGISLAGGLALGILLSVGFSLAAVLIIYYKQISEGYEDQARFDIMQKVGMTRRDIRSSINSQLLLVFFLPLLLAGLHLAFAFPFVHKLLLLFNLWNTRLLVGTTAASFLAFAALYTLVYRITSNAYYHIVSGGGER